jgi:hypothetical protein
LPRGLLPHSNAGGRLNSPLITAVLANRTLRAARRAMLPPALRLKLGQALRQGG